MCKPTAGTLYSSFSSKLLYNSCIYMNERRYIPRSLSPNTSDIMSANDAVNTKASRDFPRRGPSLSLGLIYAQLPCRSRGFSNRTFGKILESVRERERETKIVGYSCARCTWLIYDFHCWRPRRECEVSLRVCMCAERVYVYLRDGWRRTLDLRCCRKLVSSFFIYIIYMYALRRALERNR